MPAAATLFRLPATTDHRTIRASLPTVERSPPFRVERVQHDILVAEPQRSVGRRAIGSTLASLAHVVDQADGRLGGAVAGVNALPDNFTTNSALEVISWLRPHSPLSVSLPFPLRRRLISDRATVKGAGASSHQRATARVLERGLRAVAAAERLLAHVATGSAHYDRPQRRRRRCG